jgi:two-component system, LytTR family, response regulator
MKFKCLIVDDEPPAIRIIESYLLKLENMEIVAKASNAVEAFNYLQKQSVDILFLDINLPQISGINLLKILKNPPAVILTTAYSKYALESYEYNVTDYLLKPIRFERFIMAVEKAKTACHHVTPLSAVEGPEFFEFKTNDGLKKILFKEIKYLQSLGNYIRVFADGRSYVTLLSTKEAEVSLPKMHFVRIHKSYIININRVSSYSSNDVCIEDINLPIGKTYKKHFIERKENLTQ